MVASLLLHLFLNFSTSSVWMWPISAATHPRAPAISPQQRDASFCHKVTFVFVLWCFFEIRTSGGDTFSFFLSICVSSDVQRLSCLSVVGSGQTDDTASFLHVLVSCGVFLFDKNIWRVVRLIVSLGRRGSCWWHQMDPRCLVSFPPSFRLMWKYLMLHS